MEPSQHEFATPSLSPWKVPAVRRVLTAAFIDWAGAGLLLACAPVFLVQTVGLTAKEVGVALTTATIAGFVMSFPISRLADRWVASRALVALNVWRGIMFLAYAFFVHDFVSFLVVAVLIDAAELSLGPVINTLMTDLGGERDRIRYLAYFRTVVNIGITLGGLGAAVALTFPTRATFSGLLMLAAAACLVAAVELRRNAGLLIQQTVQCEIFETRFLVPCLAA